MAPPPCAHPGCPRPATYRCTWLLVTERVEFTCSDHIPRYAYSARPLIQEDQDNAL
jgi:hypothetical protein